jgi:hypothetical protein
VSCVTCPPLSHGNDRKIWQFAAVVVSVGEVGEVETSTPRLDTLARPGSTMASRTEQELRAAMDRDQTSQGPVAIRTIGDLGEHSQMYAYCNACRHSSELALAALRECCGSDLSLKTLRARLRCSRCGARSVETTHVCDAGPHARS